MERLTSLLLALAGLLVGLIIGQATAPPATVIASPPGTAASAVAHPDTGAGGTPGKLTPYERGQLIAACYQAAADYRNPIGNGSGSPVRCIEQINKLP